MTYKGFTISKYDDGTVKGAYVMSAPYSKFAVLASGVCDSAREANSAVDWLTVNEERVIELAKGLLARRIEARDVISSWTALQDYLHVTDGARG